MRGSFIKSGILVLGMSFMLADAAVAANMCSKVFKPKSTAGKMKLEAITFSRNKDLKMELSKAELESLNALVERTFGEKLQEKVDSGTTLSVPDLVIKLANLSIDKGGARTVQSDRLADVSRSLDPVTAKMTLDQ